MTKETLRTALERNWDEIGQREKELNGASDRAAAILAAAYFEAKLHDAIMREFSIRNRDLSILLESGEKIFKHNNPIKNFADKIEIAFALGLYSDEVRKNLHKIREIRNHFAHASMPITFEHDDISNKCRQLNLNNFTQPDSLRTKYINYLKEIEYNIKSKSYPLCEETVDGNGK